MLDSFLSSPYRTEFSPWPVSKHYATERAGGVPEAMLLPGELTVHRSDGAKMSYYLDWPEEFNEYTRAITLRPRTKNGYPQDFTLSVAVRDGQAVFTATALSFWEQRDGRPYDHEPIARGYVDVVAYESCEEYAGNSAAPALIGWDIAASTLHAWRSSAPSAKESPAASQWAPKSSRTGRYRSTTRTGICSPYT